MCQRLATFFQSHFPFLLGTQLGHVPAFLVLAEAICWAIGNGLWAEASGPLPGLVHKSLMCNSLVLSLPPAGGQTQDTEGEPKVSRDSGAKSRKDPEFLDDCVETSTLFPLYLGHQLDVS